jgi:hypothetical protein
MRGFKSVGSTQRFLSMHAAALSTCNVQRPTSSHLIKDAQSLQGIGHIDVA